jgi:hypothetical protein
MIVMKRPSVLQAADQKIPSTINHLASVGRSQEGLTPRMRASEGGTCIIPRTYRPTRFRVTRLQRRRESDPPVSAGEHDLVLLNSGSGL